MKLFDLRAVGLDDGDRVILDGLSLSVAAGDFLTVTGPSGGGKSTLLKILAGLVTASRGEIAYRGRSLDGLDAVAYRREVSYCVQQPVLFGQTVRDNLAFPFEIRRQAFDEGRAVAALARVNLAADFLAAEIVKLSGGERQRVALVRNLLFAPDVLLLDEVTTGLDADNKAIVHALIASEHQRGATVIAVTHDADEIAAATAVARIVAGRLTTD